MDHLDPTTRDLLTPDQLRSIDRILHGALDRGADERASFVDESCGDDDQVRREVLSLLEQCEDVTRSCFLQGSASLDGVIDVGATDRLIGQRIGPYKLLGVLGAGGCGIVFRAGQEHPTREVALKIIKPGMDSRSVIARFDGERQALALLDHPHVAKIFDSGTTEEGRPYFVMELVAGQPITDYCDEHRLPVEARLKLFVEVCRAVQHAHQKGIMHRDLKPSNILVSGDPSDPMPKVIDFGVAKALNQALGDETVQTLQGQLIGTPSYMSPEQAELGAANVDTRTDIYSMGVVLYELLVGRLPIDFTNVGCHDIVRKLRETTPLKPGTLFAALSAEQAMLIAERRATHAAALEREVRGDLARITMKAMAKDRNERYATAWGLASDVERYLRDEPVVAAPPSLLYQARKFARRNRVLVSVAAAFLIAGCLFGVTMALLYGELREESRMTLEIYQQAFEAAADAMLIIDVNDRHIVMANQAAEGLFGYSSAEFETKIVDDISAAPAATRKKFEEYAAASRENLRRDGLQHSDRPCRKKDGTIFMASIESGIFDREGRRLVLAILRDAGVPPDKIEGVEVARTPP